MTIISIWECCAHFNMCLCQQTPGAPWELLLCSFTHSFVWISFASSSDVDTKGTRLWPPHSHASLLTKCCCDWVKWKQTIVVRLWMWFTYSSTELSNFCREIVVTVEIHLISLNVLWFYVCLLGMCVSIVGVLDVADWRVRTGKEQQAWTQKTFLPLLLKVKSTKCFVTHEIHLDRFFIHQHENYGCAAGCSTHLIECCTNNSRVVSLIPVCFEP